MMDQHEPPIERPVARRIRQALEAALTPLELQVIDESRKHAGHAHMIDRDGTAGAAGETHFKIKVVAEQFRGKSRIDRHRAINGLLADEIGPNKIHALAIEARAPGE